MERTHGGDWAAYQKEYGALPLDFSANLSPLGMPESVRRAAEAAVLAAERYPDPACTALRAALSERYGVPAEQIVCGSGAADLIARVPRALRPGRVLLPVPTFTEYETALQAAGCSVDHFFLSAEEDFSLGEAFLERIEPGIDLLILCDPNNPTGRTVHPALLDRIVERCAKVGTRLMIDECFNELLDEPEAHSLASRLMECPHVILLRAFTKSFAMPGLRLGYALCGSAALAGALTAAGQPWPVSTPAQAAGLAALGEENYLRELRRLLREERAYLLSALCALGCRCVPGEANFILFYHADRSLCDKLFQRGILLRGCSDFAGLGPGWYRAAVRTRAENERFVQALEEVLRHG